MYRFLWFDSTIDLTKTRDRAFAMEHAIMIVILSGILKSADDVRLALHTSLALAVPEPKLRDYLQGLLRAPHSVASATTVRRHRLSLCVGFCNFMARFSEEMIRSPGGISRWATLDGSPQCGYELLMLGQSFIRNQDILDADLFWYS